MTFRARPTTKPPTRRRGTHAEDARRNLYFNLGFGLIVVVAILLLGNIAMATYMLIQLFRLPANARIEELLLRRP